MIDKLREVFPHLVEAKLDVPMDSENFDWYSTTDNKIVGIPNNDLTDKERQLLDTFLNPYYASQPPLTKREDDWINVLFNGGNPNRLMDETKSLSYRFIYFSLSDDMVDPFAFREAIHGLFPHKVPILWENSHEGMLIEDEEPSEDAEISYEEMIEVLMSDFYMNVRIYIGPYFKDITHAAEYYQWIKSCFHTVSHFIKEDVINHITAIPYLLLQPMGKESTEFIIHSVLKDTLTEDDLLDTVRIFLECNSNATLAAKKLYMHRNSLQYRVDKFIEKTGIDVKQFEGALSVYLTLLLKQNTTTEN